VPDRKRAKSFCTCSDFGKHRHIEELSGTLLAAMASDMILYIGSGSPPCWRAEITLVEKGLQGYQKKLLSFEKKEHKSDEILKLNPRGQVPTFLHGDININESGAICDYLEARFHEQGIKLVPDDLAQMAVVRQRQHESANLVQKEVVDLLYYIFKSKPEDIDPEQLKAKKKAFAEELAVWEGYIKAQGDGGYLVGKNFTMADVFVYPYIAFAVRMGLNLQANLPSMASWYDRITERPSVQASWPPHWKDSEGKSMLADVFAQ